MSELHDKARVLLALREKATPILGNCGCYNESDTTFRASGHDMADAIAALLAEVERLRGGAVPVLWVHPVLLNRGTLAVECSPMQLGPDQIPLYIAPPAQAVPDEVAQKIAVADWVAQNSWWTHQAAVAAVRKAERLAAAPSAPEVKP